MFFGVFTVCTHMRRGGGVEEGCRTQTREGLNNKKNGTSSIAASIYGNGMLCIYERKKIVDSFLLNCGKIERKAKKSTIINVYIDPVG